MSSASIYDGLTLNECLLAVRNFHHLIQAPVSAGPPQLLPSEPARALAYSRQLHLLSQEMAEVGTTDLLISRAGLALEELSEWLAAHGNGDLVGAADAIADRLYVLLGDVVATALPLGMLFEEVHQSNLSKIPMVQTGYGRGAKGPTYVPPNIAMVLETHALSQRERTTSSDPQSP